LAGGLGLISGKEAEHQEADSEIRPRINCFPPRKLLSHLESDLAHHADPWSFWYNMRHEQVQIGAALTGSPLRRFMENAYDLFALVVLAARINAD